MTSKAIKRTQFRPAEVERMGPNNWAVPSSSTDEKYAVTRQVLTLTIDGKPLKITRWKCGCPATTVACKHIISVVVREMRAKGWVASFWTDWKEVKRQRRKTWAMESNGQAFWVTGKIAPEVRRPHKRARFWKMQADQWRPVHDCWWMVEGCPVRVPVTL